MVNRETSEERRIREKLGGLLEANESLIVYTKGYIGPGGTGIAVTFGLIGEAVASLLRQWYYVGLTEKRLLLVPEDQQNKATSYALGDVLSLTYARKGGWISSTTVPGILRIKLRDEALEIKAKGKKWWRYAEEMASIFKGR
ncbi:MAG: hypothetical protein SXV54_02610 [Chloroflexota bacterium]|nr:hypothetical protein [Chloroflexota bacterium]